MHGRLGLVIAASGIFLWLLVGTIVYFLVENCSMGVGYIDADGNIGTKDYCPWTFGQAFYFSVQTGLSIGFGLLSESKDGSMVYSIFHILVGSSIVSGALALFASLALLRGGSFQSDEEQKIAKHAHALHTSNGYSGLRVAEIHELMVKYPHHTNAIIRKLHKTDPSMSEDRVKEFAKADEFKRREMSSKILREAMATLPEFKDDKLTVGELEAMESKHASFGYRMKMRFAEHRNVIVVGFIFWAWVAIGTIFSVVADENNFVTGLYFAVSTLSTAGMVAVKTVDSQAHVVFAGIFALIGVPLYCTYLGMFANVLIDRYNSKQVQDQLSAKFSAAETHFLDFLKNTDNDGEVDLSEFIVIQMLRLGKADMDLVENIKKQFKDMDKANKGKISKDLFLHKLPTAASS